MKEHAIAFGLLSTLVIGCARGAAPVRQVLVRVVAVEDSVPGVQRFLADGIADEIGDEIARAPGVHAVVRSQTPSARPGFTLTLFAAYAVGADRDNAPMQVRLVSTLTSDTVGASGATPTVVWRDSVEFPLASFAAERRRVTQQVTSALAHDAAAAAGQTTASVSVSERAPHDSVMGSSGRDATAWIEAFQGWHALRAGGKDNMEVAFLHFKRAIARDSTFARAYLGLAAASAEYVDMQTGPNAEGDAETALRLAARSVQQARRLDDDLAEAHALAATMQMRNVLTVDPEIARVLTRRVHSPTVAVARAATSRDAIGALRSAAALDPECAAAHAALALALLEAGDATAASSSSARAATLEPTNVRWRAVHMLARILAHDYADAFAECEVFAGGAAACNALWSDSTNADERARILSARWAYSAGTSGGTLVVPVLVAALWPLPRAASLPPLQGVSDLDSAQTAMNVRALRATQDAPTTSYPSVILIATRNWIRPFRDGRDWKSYVAAHAMSSQVLPSKRAR